MFVTAYCNAAKGAMRTHFYLMSFAFATILVPKSLILLGIELICWRRSLLVKLVVQYSCTSSKVQTIFGVTVMKAASHRWEFHAC